jgi:hypothetical protein
MPWRRRSFAFGADRCALADRLVSPTQKFPFPFPCRAGDFPGMRATIGNPCRHRRNVHRESALGALSAGRASAPGASQNPFWPNTKKSSEVVKYAIATECKASSRILSDRCREVLADCVTFQQPGIKPVTRVRSPLRAGGGKKYKCRAASLKNNSAAGGSKQTGVPVRRT